MLLWSLLSIDFSPAGLSNYAGDLSISANFSSKFGPLLFSSLPPDAALVGVSSIVIALLGRMMDVGVSADAITD